jgi:hypothetical protein
VAAVILEWPRPKLATGKNEDIALDLVPMGLPLRRAALLIALLVIGLADMAQATHAPQVGRPGARVPSRPEFLEPQRD